MEKLKLKSFKSAKSFLFYVAILALPVLQFCIFYIAVNINSFILAFRKITLDAETKKYIFSWTFDNFKNWFADKNEFLQLTQTLLISLKSYVISLVIGVPLGLLFAYYIFKKLPGAMFFRFMLFMPSIIASIVLVSIFKYFTDYVVPEILNFFHIELKGALLSEKSTRYATVMFYNLFVSFGTTVLLYSNKMVNISPEIIEAAQLDGATKSQELRYIILPFLKPIIIVMTLLNIGNIFRADFGLFFNVPRNVGALYPTTDVVDTYVYRALTQLGDVGMSAAVGLVQSLVGFVLILVTNLIVRKIDPESALF